MQEINYFQKFELISLILHVSFSGDILWVWTQILSHSFFPVIYETVGKTHQQSRHN
jgi:hypothetical protein